MPTATNPTTGEKLMLSEGQWIPYSEKSVIETAAPSVPKMTATNPQTGERVYLDEKTNQWAPIAKPGPLETFGRGLAHGTLGLGETVGLGTQWLGKRLGSETISEVGKTTADYWGEKAKGFEPPTEIAGKNVFDNPEILAKSSFWLYNVADMVPALAASMIPAAGVGKAVSVAGKAYAWTPKVAERLIKLGQYVAGGLSGGGLEGAQTYKTVLEQGGTEEEAARSGEAMTLGAGVLNALSIGKILNKAGVGFKAKIVKHLGAAAWEGITEGAEEPTEVFSKYVGKYLAGEELPESIRGDLIESLKSAITVAPIAAVTGFGGSVIGSDKQPAPVTRSTTGLGAPVTPEATKAPVVPTTPQATGLGPVVQPEAVQPQEAPIIDPVQQAAIDRQAQIDRTYLPAEDEIERNRQVRQSYGLGRAPEPAQPTVAKTPETAPQVSIPEFTNTDDAVKFGETATPDQVAMMGELRKAEGVKTEAAMEAEDYENGMISATKGQFYREAIEASKGEHPSQIKPREPEPTPKAKEPLPSHMEDDPANLEPRLIETEISRTQQEQAKRQRALSNEAELAQKAQEGGLTIDEMRQLLENNYRENQTRLDRFIEYSKSDEFKAKKSAASARIGKIKFTDVTKAKEPWEMKSSAWMEGRPTEKIVNDIITGDPGVNPSVKMRASAWLEKHKDNYSSELAKAEFPSSLEMSTRAHKQIVKQAVKEGKPVPPEVLKDYPDLTPPAVSTQAAEPSEKAGAATPKTKVTVTDKGVRDHSQQAVIQGDTITVNMKVGNKKRGSYTIPLSEWEATEKGPSANPAWNKKKLAEKYGNVESLREERGGSAQADRIIDSSIMAIEKAYKQREATPEPPKVTEPAKPDTQAVGKAWIDNQQRPIYATKKPKGKRNVGKVIVTLALGKTAKIDESKVISWPTAPSEAAQPKETKPAMPGPSKTTVSKVATLRGMIKKLGRINPLNFKGEVSDWPLAAKRLTKKTGLPIDLMEQSLKDEGWLRQDEDLLELLRTDKEALKRGKVAGEMGIGETGKKTEFQKKEAEKIKEFEPEGPPEGKYKTVKVDDLPEGLTLTIIENRTSDGWDEYKVIKTKEGVTLQDGVKLELEPWDTVEVLESDLPKAEPEYINSTPGKIEVKTPAVLSLRQETAGKQRPTPMGEAVGKKNQESLGLVVPDKNQPGLFEKKEAKSEPSKKIEDAGEELWYNKRNRMGNGVKWADVKDLNPTLKTKEVTKSKVWPRPDYQQLVDDGMFPFSAHILKQVYDSIPNKPAAATDDEMQFYIEEVQRVKEALFTWAKDREATKGLLDSLTAHMRPMAAAQAGRPVSITSLATKKNDSLLKVVYPEYERGVFRRDGKYNRNVNALGGNKFLKAIQPGGDAAVKAIKDLDMGWPGTVEAWQKRGFKVAKSEDSIKVEQGYTYGKDNKKVEVYWLSADKGSIDGQYKTREEAEEASKKYKPWLLLTKYRRIKGQFDTQDAAKEEARNLTKKSKEGGGITDFRLAMAEANREGPDYREPGEDVTSDKMKEVFGFRGVNFGNWTNQNERQASLNAGYDALMDLATTLDVPPKAISLNGIMGLAFGAQGSGKYGAHFVPGVNEINLTKTKGAGALAHEVGHAIDHYFATQAGLQRSKEPYLSHHTDGQKGAEIRPEIVQAFNKIVDTMTHRTPTAEERATIRQERKARDLKVLNRFLSPIRKDIESFADATEKDQALKDFDELADRLRDGDMGTGYAMAGKLNLPQVVAEIRLLVMDKAKPSGIQRNTDMWKGLSNWASSIAYVKNKKEAETDHIPQIKTDYVKGASELDKDKKGKKYWTEHTELFSRAFESYVLDKITDRNQKNTYLSSPIQDTEKQVYPYGAERKAINEAFDNLFNIMEAKETPRGTALYKVSDAGSEIVKKYSIDAEDVPVKGWAGRTLFHGTESTSAEAITSKGIDNAKSTKGYFGRGFYMASDYNVAKDNYADFAEDEDAASAVIAVKVSLKARILDLRDEKDSEIYMKVSQNGRLIGNDNFDKLMVRNKIDGLFDRSFGGVVIYNPKVLEPIKTGEKGGPLYKVPDATKSGQVTTADIQSFFKGQNVGLSNDGSVWVRTKSGHGVQIKTVQNIAPDKAAFQIAYGRQKRTGEFISGKYQDGTIELQKDISDKWTLRHEQIHWMEDVGILTDRDIYTINHALKNRKATKEDRAAFMEGLLKGRSETKNSKIKAIIQKIQDFIDGLVNLFQRTARGIARDIESGKIFEQSLPDIAFEFAQPLMEVKDASKNILNNPNFVKWFGDSKVTDADGKPLVVYHGTPDVRELSEFTTARERMARAVNKDPGYNDKERAFFFTADYGVAKTYADDHRAFDYQGAEPAVMSVYLSLKNPMIINHEGKNWHGTRSAIEKARETGHDGIIIKNVVDDYQTTKKSKPTTVYVSFGPTQIKSIFNRGTFDPNDARILYEKTAQRWHSQMTNFISDKLPGKGTGKAYLDTINSWAKKGMIKSEELSWSGLTDWLPQQENVTKQAVVDFLAANNVQVQEVEKGEQKAKVTWASDVDGGYIGTHPDADEYYFIEKKGDNSYELTKGDVSEAIGTFDTVQDAKDAAEEIHTPYAVGSTKFSQYQVPGGESYKELLLTMPARESANNIDAKKNVDDFWSRMEAKYGDSPRTALILKLNDSERAERRNLVASFQASSPEYKSAHWDEPGVLVHIRMNDRVGPKGEKILFLEEIQSDAHQEGRKKGYKTGELPKGWAVKNTGGLNPWVVTDAGGNETRYRGPTKKVAIENATESAVPNMPFKKTWPLLAIKRMVRFASENGYDSIAWTPGVAQVQRYEDATRAVVDKIIISPLESSKGMTFALTAHKGGSIVLQKDFSTESELSDLIGKGMAAKAFEQLKDPNTAPPVVLEGKDLTVGGEGMKGFYDRILPAEVNKFFNKAAWGNAKVGTVEIDTFGNEYQAVDYTGRSLGVYPTRQEAEAKVNEWEKTDGVRGKVNEKRVGKDDLSAHSLPITPEMKQKSLREGMPLFQKTEFPMLEIERMTKEQAQRVTQAKSDLQADTFSAIDKFKSLMTKAKPLVGTKKDLDYWGDLIASIPAFFKEKIYAVKRIVESTDERMDEKHETEFYMENHELKGVPGIVNVVKAMNDLSRQDRKKFGEYLVKTDQMDFGFKIREEKDIGWVVKDRSGHANVAVVGKGPGAEFEAQDKMLTYEAEDLQKQGFTPEQVNVVMAVRMTTNKGFEMLMQPMRKIIADIEAQNKELPEDQQIALPRIPVYRDGKKTTISLKQAMAEMGDTRGSYFPRIRKPGRYVMTAHKEGADSILETHDSRFLNKPRVAELEKQGYTVTEARSNKLGEDVFQMTGNLVKTQQVINAALERVEKQAKDKLSNKQLEGINKEIENIFATALAEQVSNVIRERGARAHMTKRSGDLYLGYEENPLLAIPKYIKGLAGSEAKKNMVGKMMKALTGTEMSWADYQAENPEATKEDYAAHVKEMMIEQGKQPVAFKWAIAYIGENTRNPDFADNVIGMLRGAAVGKYLAFRVFSAPLVNLTALPTSTIATLKGAGLSYGRAWKELGRGIKQYGQYIADGQFGTSKLSEKDKWIFEYMDKKGWTDAQYTSESLAALRSNLSRGWDNIIKVGMFTFSQSEKLNRAATISAAFNGLSRLSENKGKTKEQIAEMAKQVSDDSHGVYNKGNYPYIALGGNPAAHIARMMYVFQRFSHTYLLNMRKLGFEKKDYVALTHMIVAPAVLAGAGASVLTPIISALLRAFGIDDSEEEAYKKVAESFGPSGENLARFGLAGLAGFTIKGSLALGVGAIPTSIKDVLGAPGSVMSDIFIDGIPMIAEGDIAKGFEKIVPTGFGNLIRAYRESTEGLTTKGNRPVFYGNKQVKTEGYETFLRAISLYPSRVAAIREKQYKEYLTEAKYTEKRADIYAKIKKFYLSSDRSKARWLDILAEIQAYNERARSAGVTIITGKSISMNIKRSFKPSRRERMRGRQQ
uniref:Putative poly(ADP-ribose) polymerase n=1 Tax=viral metagenome TaxID=1070528 RepID=A0A6M3XDY4_9ZZZZ